MTKEGIPAELHFLKVMEGFSWSQYVSQCLNSFFEKFVLSLGIVDVPFTVTMCSENFDKVEKAIKSSYFALVFF